MGLSGLKADASLELTGDQDLGMGSSSFVRGYLLKIGGMYAGGGKETICKTKNSTNVLI